MGIPGVTGNIREGVVQEVEIAIDLTPFRHLLQSSGSVIGVLGCLAPYIARGWAFMIELDHLSYEGEGSPGPSTSSSILEMVWWSRTLFSSNTSTRYGMPFFARLGPSSNSPPSSLLMLPGPW